ncbi:hypothetical protein D3C78_963590 [compost metagenome]
MAEEACSARNTAAEYDRTGTANEASIPTMGLGTGYCTRKIDGWRNAEAAQYLYGQGSCYAANGMEKCRASGDFIIATT